MSTIERWRDRVAVVTGASSGIGLALVHALAQGGMRVVACARREGPLILLSDRYGADRVLAVTCDLRAEESILDLFARADERWGGVDVLVNNAGLGYHAPLVSGSTERWREMLEVNVLGLCIATREAVERMRRRGDDGVVVHISSLSAHRVPDGSGVYAASKHAVRALTEALRQELLELGSGIRVCSVSPGFVETGFAAHYHGSEERARETYGRYEVLQPTDVAEAVLWILSQPPRVQVHDLLLRPREQPT